MRSAFHNHKSNAKKRGIAFHFTYEDWCSWWEEQLGPDWANLRGCRRGQYVMARYQDEGVYVRGNVRPLKAEENIASYNRRRTPVGGRYRLTDEVVRSVYLDKSKYSVISKKYGVTKHKIQCIKQKHYYRNITDELG